MTRWAMLGVAMLALGACDRPVPVAPLVDQCPVSATAPVESEPQGPVLTDAQRQSADVAIIVAVGDVVGVEVIRHSDVEHPAWGRRQAARVEATRAWCAARRPASPATPPAPPR